MKSDIKFNSPINLIKNDFNKSNSLTNFFPKTTTNKFYKIRERLFSPNSLSLMSSTKNKFTSNFNSFKTTYFTIMQNLKSNDVDLKETKLGIKSLDNLLINIKHLKKFSKQKNFFGRKKENKNEIKKNENKIPNIISYVKSKKNQRKFHLGKPIFFSEKIDKNKNNIFTEKYGKILENNRLFEEKKYIIPNLKLVNQVLKINKETKIENIKEILPMK